MPHSRVFGPCPGSTMILTAKRRSGIISGDLHWGVAKWQGTGFWSRDRRFESCRPSRRRRER